jgi:hypothetical protein
VEIPKRGGGAGQQEEKIETFFSEHPGTIL